MSRLPTLTGNELGKIVKKMGFKQSNRIPFGIQASRWQKNNYSIPFWGRNWSRAVEQDNQERFTNREGGI